MVRLGHPLPTARRSAIVVPRLLGSFVLAVAISGCKQPIDLAAVQKYAETTATASASFNTLANGFAASCHRVFQLEAFGPYLADTDIDLAPAVRPVLAPPPPPTHPLLRSQKDLQALFSRDAPHCIDADGVSADWVKANDTVTGYVQALGQIAGVDTAPKIDALGTALVGAKILTPTQNTAITTLADKIGQLVVMQDKEDALRRAITDADAPLRESIAALKSVAGDYANQLHGEFNVTFNVYHCAGLNDLARVVAAKHGKRLRRTFDACSVVPGSADSALVTDTAKLGADDVPNDLRLRMEARTARMNALLAAINTQRSATLKYSATLDTLLKTHADLYTAAGKNATIADLVHASRSDVVELAKDVAALQQAVK